MFYINKETGTIRSREEWIKSYHHIELSVRKMSAEDCFEQDSKMHFNLITPSYCIRPDTMCKNCTLKTEKGTDCRGHEITNI